MTKAVSPTTRIAASGSEKKRGRPRKYPVTEVKKKVEAKNKNDVSPKPKRGRGRPKKIADEATGVSLSSDQETEVLASGNSYL